jgi:hypothetical protein
MMLRLFTTSNKNLYGALKERYEGGLALLKYKKVFNGRCRKSGETLHSYLSELRLAYERAYSPPTVDPLPEGTSAEVKNERFKQEGALAFYNKGKNEDVLCQFINGLDKDLKEVLIRQDDHGRTGRKKLGGQKEICPTFSDCARPVPKKFFLEEINFGDLISATTFPYITKLTKKFT